MRRMLALNFVLLLTLLTQAAISAEIIVISDSLSDTGNFSLATAGTLPPAPLYYNGRFSNGPLWIEHLANQLGRSVPTPSLSGGTNFAINGARVSGPSPFMTPDLVTQANLYVASLGGGSPALDDLFVVWGGSNDLFFSLTGQVPPITTTDLVQDVSSVISTLAAAGANEFLVPNLAPLGQTPFFNATPLSGPLDAAAADFNTQLSAELAMLAADLGVVIHELDVHGLFEDAIADPAAFGLTNVTDSATIFDPVTGIGIAPDAPNPNEFLFFDSVHPTATVHQILGDRAFALVTPEPASLAIWGLVGLIAVVGLRKVRARRGTAIQDVS